MNILDMDYRALIIIGLMFFACCGVLAFHVKWRIEDRKKEIKL